MTSHLFHVFIFIFISFFAPLQAQKYPPPEAAGEEFALQAEDFIISRSRSGHGLRDVYDRSAETALRADTRDWEAVLSTLIADPGKYGVGVSGMALDAAIFRGKSGEAEVLEASRKLLDASVRTAVDAVRKGPSENRPPDNVIRTGLAGRMYQLIDSGVPANLSMLLDYLNSPEEELIQLAETPIPKAIAIALRNYGTESHAIPAKEFAERLRSRGKAEPAEDIERTAQRLEHGGPGGRDASGSGATPETAGTRSASTAGSKERGPAALWLIPPAVALAAWATRKTWLKK